MTFATWSLAAVLAGTPAPADTLRLADAVALARAANPMLAAARLRAEAAAERVAPAGALPDPQLGLALMNRMVGAPGSTMDPMTMNQVQVSQMFPWPGTLAAGRERATRLAGAAGFEAEEAERMLVARVEGTYYQIAGMDRALTIMANTRALMRELVGITQTMYGVGEGPQQDVLQAQVAVARMTEDILLMEAERRAMAARFNALLGRAASDPVGALELPGAVGPMLSPDSLMRLAEHHRPALAAARERIRAAEAGTRAAERERYPDLMVGVQYAGRPRYDNMASLMLGVSVPLRAGARQRPMWREMQAMEAMARAEALALVNETHALIAELVAMVERSRILAELYATSILPQARASGEGALAAYRVGRVNFMSVIENQMTVNRYETERVRLIAAYHAARAELAALTGGEGGIP
jgi:cobalt-zinc-cadmium efflux system outer membrane protein